MHKRRNSLGSIFLTNAHDKAFLWACGDGCNKVTCQVRFAVGIDKVPFHIEIVATRCLRLVSYFVTIRIDIGVLREPEKSHARNHKAVYPLFAIFIDERDAGL